MSWEHPFGTDFLGRDIDTRTLFGARVSLIAGSLSVLLGAVLGTVMGITAGYLGGWTEAVKAGGSTPVLEERRAAYREVARIFREDRFILPIIPRVRLFVSQDEVSSVGWSADGFAIFEKAEISEKKADPHAARQVATGLNRLELSVETQERKWQHTETGTGQPSG